MTGLALQIVPTMPVGEIVETAVAAEELGYEFCQVADEGVMRDVYVILGAVAGRTERLKIGAATNPYTRHPAVTAAAMATISELTGGRAFLTLVAGGSMVLEPLGIERHKPAAVIAESIELMRRLWTGEAVDFAGRHFQLENSRLGGEGPFRIPIFMAARGERLLRLAGEVADGVVLMAKADLGSALSIVEQGRLERQDWFSRFYLDRLAFTSEMIEEARLLYSYALFDSPDRVLANLGLDELAIWRLRQAMASGGPDAVAGLITTEMISAYQIAGPIDECERALKSLIAEHGIDTFMMNIISPGLERNVDLLRQVAAIAKAV